MSIKKKITIPILVCLFSYSSLIAQNTDQRANRRTQQPNVKAALQPTLADVKYGAHIRNRLDFYQVKSDRATPLALYIHGGGFRGGSKKGVNQRTLKAFLDAGISVAAIEYRLVPAYPLPTAHQDSLRALQYIRSQAGTWHINKDRIGAFGGSAGAQICMWLAFHGDMAEPQSQYPLKRESSRLWCVATKGGQTTMDFDWWKQCVPGYDKPHRPRSEYFGDMKGDQLNRIITDISAQSLITTDDPPIWMEYGMRPDDPIPSDSQKAQGWKVHHVAFGIKLKAMMDALGVESHLNYPGKQTKYRSVVDFFIAKLTSGD